MMENPNVSIIGTGALGSVLTRALASEGFSIAGVYNRSDGELKNLAEDAGAQRSGSFPKTKAELGDIIFLTVSDDAIRDAADRLDALADDFSGCIVVHCSGSKSSDDLSSLKTKGAAAASFHPLQTFTASSEPADLSGIFFDAEGDEEALKFLGMLARRWDSQLLQINAEAKPYLHAAAVMASNYLVALLEEASSIAEQGGMNKQEALNALLPLVRQTLRNSLQSASLTEALSGPIARGDHATVKQHIELLEQNPQALALYKQLGIAALDLSETGNKISETEVETLRKLLKS